MQQLRLIMMLMGTTPRRTNLIFKEKKIMKQFSCNELFLKASINPTIIGLWNLHQFGGASKTRPYKNPFRGPLGPIFFYISLIGGQK